MRSLFTAAALLACFDIFASAQPATARKAAPAKSAPATAAAARSVQSLKFPPLRLIPIPEVATFTLPNGIRLYLLEHHELPLVGGFALVRTGSLFDPKDKIGLAQVTGSLMRTGGTKAKTGDQIDEQLENVAAAVESGIGDASGSVSFNTLRENTDQVLEIFRDVLTQPEFREDKIELIKTQLRSSISRRNDNAGAIAAREFSDIVYGKDTPFGWRMEYEHVDRIKRDDLVAFHRRYFFPANTMIAIQGDFKTAEMRSKIEKLFGGWNHTQPAVPDFPKVSARPAPGVYLAVKPDVNQTFFQVGHLGGILKDKDYPALEVMADILGGGFSSRLFAKVRTELGYAYGISSGWSADYLYPGLFRVAGSTKSASTTETIEVIRQEVDKLRTKEVSDQELRTAKDTVLNGFVFRFDHPSKTLNRLITYEYYGYPKDFIRQYQAAIDVVTKADILRVAREHVKPENFTIVAVGKPDDFGKPLTAIDPNPKTIDLTSPTPARDVPKTSDATAKQGKELLQRVQKAVGGIEKIAAINDSVQSFDVAMQTPQGAMKATQRNFWIAPNHFRQESELPFGKIAIYSDGKTGWFAGPQGTQPAPPPVLKQVQGELFRMIFTLLASDRDPTRKVNAVGPNRLRISDAQGEAGEFEVDAQTGLLTSGTFPSIQTGGASQDVTVKYSDWRDVGGLKLPHKATLSAGSQPMGEATVTEWKLNSGLKVEDLRKQP